MPAEALVHGFRNCGGDLTYTEGWVMEVAEEGYHCPLTGSTLGWEKNGNALFHTILQQPPPAVEFHRKLWKASLNAGGCK